MSPLNRGSRDLAPVIAAEALLRHGLNDDEVTAYVARTWALDHVDCGAAVRAAHVLLRHETQAGLQPERARKWANQTGT